MRGPGHHQVDSPPGCRSPDRTESRQGRGCRPGRSHTRRRIELKVARPLVGGRSTPPRNCHASLLVLSRSRRRPRWPGNGATSAHSRDASGRRRGRCRRTTRAVPWPAGWSGRCRRIPTRASGGAVHRSGTWARSAWRHSCESLRRRFSTPTLRPGSSAVASGASGRGPAAFPAEQATPRYRDRSAATPNVPRRYRLALQRGRPSPVRGRLSRPGAARPWRVGVCGLLSMRRPFLGLVRPLIQGFVNRLNVENAISQYGSARLQCGTALRAVWLWEHSMLLTIECFARREAFFKRNLRRSVGS